MTVLVDGVDAEYASVACWIGVFSAMSGVGGSCEHDYVLVHGRCDGVIEVVAFGTFEGERHGDDVDFELLCSEQYGQLEIRS